jgi:amino acid transporter
MASERIPKWKALPIFSSDALSSVGYGPEQIAIILAAIPALGLYTYYKDVVIAIIILLGIVALSYSQIIKANPGGGGSYIIAKNI